MSEWFKTLLLVCGVAFCLIPTSRAQASQDQATKNQATQNQATKNQATQNHATSSAEEVSRTQVEVGFDGHIKLGKWTPLFITVPPGHQPVRFEVTAIDGDDTPTIYTGTLLKDARDTQRYQAWVRIGRKYDDVELHLLDANGQVLEKLTLELHGDQPMAEILASTRPLVLTLEPQTVVKDALDSMARAGSASRVVVSIGPEHPLPLNWIGYQGVDKVFLVTSDLDRIEKIADQQLAALDQWVQKGGTLIVSVAKNAPALLTEGGILQRFSPGEFVDVIPCRNSNRLESFADSQEQLITNQRDQLPITELKNSSGAIVIDDNHSHPLIIKRAFGLGQVLFVTFDLDSDRLTQWIGFQNLVGRLATDSQGDDSDATSQLQQRGTSVTHYGYEDLVGQLRVPLDAFSKVRFVQFTWIALLIGLYILCIGPGDYFFLRKVTGRMELTWITFPLVSLLFCGLAIGVSRMARPDTIQLNQLEIIDIDVVAGRTRGSVWTNLYSPKSGTCDIELERNNHLGFELESDLLSWHGLPGDGLGGMLTNVNPGLLKTSYRQDFEVQGQQITTKIIDLPLQVSSTKPLFGQWWSENPIQPRSRLRYNAKLNQISGTVTNPFDFPLNNCRILFEDWAYSLNEPLLPGQTVNIATDTNEKNLRSLLTRKTKESEESNRSNNSPWDPTDTRINRIADMMMFFQAAGGSNYTGLTHDYQSFTDMTEHLNLQRAILIGETQSLGTGLILNGQPAAEQYDQAVTIIRIVFPVGY